MYKWLAQAVTIGLLFLNFTQSQQVSTGNNVDRIELAAVFAYMEIPELGYHHHDYINYHIFIINEYEGDQLERQSYCYFSSGTFRKSELVQMTPSCRAIPEHRVHYGDITREVMFNWRQYLLRMAVSPRYSSDSLQKYFIYEFNYSYHINFLHFKIKFRRTRYTNPDMLNEAGSRSFPWSKVINILPEDMDCEVERKKEIACIWTPENDNLRLITGGSTYNSF